MRPIFPEERDGKAGKAPARPQEPLEDDRRPEFPPEDVAGGTEGPTFEPDTGGAGGND